MPASWPVGQAPLGEQAPLGMLVSTQDRSTHVAACCERAEAAGVRAGMTLAHARSLLANHPAWEQPYTPDDDAKDLKRLACWATRFAPVVAVDPPDGLLLDIAGCEHLYGGEEPLVQRVSAALERLGFPCRLCVAPTFACAQAVARFGNQRIAFVSRDAIVEALSPLPIAALRVDPVVCQALSEVAVERIGDLLPIPREDLASRFGAANRQLPAANWQSAGDLLRRFDQALGVVPEHLEPILVSQPIVVSRTFDGPVLNVEIVTLALRELLSTLVQELERKESGVCDLRIAFRRIGLEPVFVSLTMTYPTHDFLHLWSLLRPKVERVHLGYGVEEIHLEAVRTARLVHEQNELWAGQFAVSTKTNDSQTGKFVDQLIDRLGRNAVMRVTPVEHYLPERAFQRRPLAESPPKTTSGIDSAPRCQPATAGCQPAVCRPSWLLASPEPIEVVALVPDGPPAWLKWQGQECLVRFSTGPERIALPWWGDDLSTGTRDYYEVQDELGRFLWVFRDCPPSRGLALPQATCPRQRACPWFVHGVWA